MKDLFSAFWSNMMSDTLSTTFEIGGFLNRSEIQGLLNIIESGDWYCEYELNEQSLTYRNSIILSDDERRDGDWDDLVAFCQKHGLSYKIIRRGCYGCDSEVMWWDTLMKEEWRTITNVGGNPVIPEDELKDVIATYDIDPRPPEQMHSEMVLKLKDLLLNVPDTPPFLILEE